MQIFEKNQSSSKGTHLSRQYFSGWHMSSKGSFWTLQQCSRLPNGILSSIFFFFIPYYREITCSQSVLFSFLFFSFLFNHRRKLYHPEQKSEAAVHPLCLVFIFMNCASCLLEWLTPSNSCKHTSHICFHHADYLMYNFNSSCVVEFFFLSVLPWKYALCLYLQNTVRMSFIVWDMILYLYTHESLQFFRRML